VRRLWQRFRRTKKGYRSGPSGDVPAICSKFYEMEWIIAGGVSAPIRTDPECSHPKMLVLEVGYGYQIPSMIVGITDFYENL
jgi:hypothetical protein